MIQKRKFKKTEIGMIPEDWIILELGELGEFRNGVNFNRTDFGKGLPIINVKICFVDIMQLLTIWMRLRKERLRIRNHTNYRKEIYYLQGLL